MENYPDVEKLNPLIELFQIVITFSQNLTLQGAFESAAQINEKIKRTKFDGAFCKKFKLLIDRLKVSLFVKFITHSGYSQTFFVRSLMHHEFIFKTF